jgi:hypothetical protein
MLYSGRRGGRGDMLPRPNGTQISKEALNSLLKLALSADANIMAPTLSCPLIFVVPYVAGRGAA